MKTLLDKWQPTKWFGKVIKIALNTVLLILFLTFIVIPFLRLDSGWLEAFKWMWIGLAILHLDQFAGYKKARKEKIIYPIFSLFAGFTLFYICNYWTLIPLSVAIVCSIVIGLLEFGISVKVYEAMRFTAKAELRSLPLKATDTILLGSVYASAVSLFILGHFLSETMIFVFGIITMIMLFSSVISVISKGFSSNKSIVTTIIIILDIVSVLFLIGYLIYLIPGGEENNNLQEIVLALASAVIGGALTLAGVAWTIKNSDNNRKEDERKKARPTFSFAIEQNLRSSEIPNLLLFEKNETIEDPNVLLAVIENSEQSTFVIEQVYHDSKWWKSVGINSVIIPGKSIHIYFSFTNNKNVILQIRDLLGERHYYSLQLVFRGLESKGRASYRASHTIYSFAEMALDEVEQITNNGEN